jgi:hypothetical protein
MNSPRPHANRSRDTATDSAIVASLGAFADADAEGRAIVKLSAALSQH